MFKKMSAAACMLLMAASVSACGPAEEDNNGTSCEDGQINIAADVKSGETVVIAKGCYDTCENDAACGAGNKCQTTSAGGVCVTGTTTPTNNNDKPNNDTPNNDTPNNSTSNNSTSNNSTSNNTTNTGNTGNTNTGNTTTTTPPNNNSTPVPTGDACGGDADCGASGTCVTGFPEGYCSVIGCSTDGDCGATGICASVSDTQTACLATCADDTGCRSGYTCQDGGAGATVCLPEPAAPGDACETEDDCGGATCFGFGEQGYCAFGCNGDNPCPDGFSCGLFNQLGQDDIGICQPDCTDDSMCRSDLSCVDSDGDADKECFVPVASGTGTPADGCTSVEDCAGGLDGFCLEEDTMSGEFVGGYCTLTCELDDECGVGNHCALKGRVISGNATVGLCVRGCADGSQCGAGQFCTDADASGNKECWGQDIAGPCNDTTPCDAGEHCAFKGDVNANPGDGICLADCTDASMCETGEFCVNGDDEGPNECFDREIASGSGAPGDACTSTTDCAGGFSGQCIEEQSATDFPGGYCITGCDAADPNSCVAGSACTTLTVDMMGGTADFCLATCDANNACRTGYECIDPATGMPGASGFCF